MFAVNVNTKGEISSNSMVLFAGTINLSFKWPMSTSSGAASSTLQPQTS
jgi:hypothetical protein